MEEAIFTEARRFAEVLFEGDGGGHDIWHTVRVHDLAVSICEREGGDMGTVRLAALLHDADDRKLFGENGMANARSFMESHGIPEGVRDHVLLIISQVSFRGTDSVTPDTLEGRIVQDADRLDAMGAVGIARAFAYGGSRGRPMHVPGEAPSPGMDGRAYEANRGTTVNHFHEKLLLLRDMMNTPTARAMAESRHAYMEAFLEEFGEEWEGRRRSPQHEVVLPELQDAVPLHPAELRRHGAPVHAQVVGHLLPVHGYHEVAGPGGAGLVGQEGAYLLPGGPLRQLVKSAVHVQGDPGEAPHQVLDQPVVELAGRGAHVGRPAHVQVHYLRGALRDDADVQGAGGAGVVGAEHPALADVRQDGAVPPPVLPDLPDAARYHHAQAVGAVAAAEHELPLAVPAGERPQALQHGLHLPVLYPLEEAGVPQDQRLVAVHLVAKTTFQLY